jgi:formylglycine-generating enzyme required for sulfatase activity
VGDYIPNSWGFYDMHGNVSEWVEDWYQTYPSNPLTDPQGPSLGSERLIRGGSWQGAYQGTASSADRHPVSVNYQKYDLGFRLALKQTP